MNDKEKIDSLIKVLQSLAFHDRAQAMREDFEGCLELQLAEELLEKLGKPHGLQKCVRKAV